MLAMSGPAWAQAEITENPDPPSPPADHVDEEIVVEADEEIVVYGDLIIARTRGELIKDIRRLGYRPGDRKDGKTVFRPEEAWRPTVVIHDDGFVILKRSPVRFEPYIKGNSNLRYLACIPPFGLMCIRPGGQTVSRAKLGHQEALVAYSIDPEVDDWRQAVVDTRMQGRIEAEIPDLLDAAWQEGAPIERHAAPLATAAERRSELLRFWADRSCTPEGDRVRVAVEAFLEFEVNDSDHPLTGPEVLAANAATPCERRLPPYLGKAP